MVKSSVEIQKKKFLKFSCHVAGLAESEWREWSWETLSDNFLDGEEGFFKIDVNAIVVITIAAAAVAAFY
jgi:hypothetical protein